MGAYCARPLPIVYEQLLIYLVIAYGLVRRV